MKKFLDVTIRNTNNHLTINTDYLIKVEEDWIDEKNCKAKLTLVDEVIYVEEYIEYFDNHLGLDK